MVELAQEMVHRVAEDRILSHPTGSKRQTGSVANAAKGCHGLATFTFRELAPDLGTGAVGPQIVHVDAILTEQGQHILRGLHKLRHMPILQSAAQSAETFLILGGFRKMQGANEIVDRQWWRQSFGGGAECQGCLFLPDGGAAYCERCLLFGGGSFGRSRTDRGENSDCRVGLAMCGRNLFKLAFEVWLYARGAGLLLLQVAVAHCVDRSLQAHGFFFHDTAAARGRGRDPDQRNRHENRD